MVRVEALIRVLLFVCGVPGAAAARLAPANGCSGRLAADIFVVDVAAYIFEDEQSECKYEEEEDPRQQGGVAHVEILQTVAIDIEDIEEGSVLRAAAGD